VTLADALDRVLPLLRDEVCVHANGFISRAACARRDRETSFYMIGSMGLASSIGLGLALARPERRVLVLDGDGNVLMNPGALARIGAAAPPNLLHLCFDNGVHASTGGQPTISGRVHLEELARAAGYRWVGRVATPEVVAAEVSTFLGTKGPAFLLIALDHDPAAPPGPRIPHAPEAMTARLRRALELDA